MNARLSKPLKIVVTDDSNIICDQKFEHREKAEHEVADQVFDALKAFLAEQGVDLAELGCPVLPSP